MSPRLQRCFLCLALAGAATGLLPAGTLGADAAGEGAAGAGSPAAADATSPAAVLEEGSELGWDDLLALRDFLPPEIWRYRDRFFHPDMRMQIGPRQRRYPLPVDFERATRRADGRGRLDAHGNLLGHVPGDGLPFDPGRIDPGDPDAALRWVWNFARRHRAAGPRGSFLIVDLPSRVGSPQFYRGEWYWWVAPPAEPALAFAAGGRFHAPSPVRRLAWQQRRPLRSAGDASTPDETFVYLPNTRRVRRASGAWVDGLFTPSYSARAGSAPAAAPVAAAALDATEPLRRGWLGLTVRPNAYRWRLIEQREVLAPLNVARSGYPLAPNRSFGPSGLSAADDRWELRRAVVVQGALREGGRGYELLTLYLDADTLQPLYYAAQLRGGRLVEVGIQLHRFSDDVTGYPLGADGLGLSVFDPVAAVFVHTADGGSGWRRESYDVLSSPPTDADGEHLLSADYLSRAR